MLLYKWEVAEQWYGYLVPLFLSSLNSSLSRFDWGFRHTSPHRALADWRSSAQEKWKKPDNTGMCGVDERIPTHQKPSCHKRQRRDSAPLEPALWVYQLSWGNATGTFNPPHPPPSNRLNVIFSSDATGNQSTHCHRALQPASSMERGGARPRISTNFLSAFQI